METIVQLKKRGIVVIPEPLRLALNLNEGDILKIDVTRIEKQKAQVTA